MNIRRISFFLTVSLLCVSASVSWGQSSSRSRYGSSMRSGTRSLPVKYQADSPGELPSADDIINQERNSVPDSPAPRNTPPQQPMLEEPMSDVAPEMESAPKAEPLPGRSTAPAKRAPAQQNYPPPAAHETWSEEVDSFAGHDTWDGGAPGCCDSCGDGDCCGSCGGCCDGGCGCHGCGWYGRGEYMIMWAAGQEVPALVTTSPVGVTRANAGVLGVATTSTLFGDGTLNTNSRSGARAGVGYWLSDCFAIEGEYLTIGDSNDNFTLASSSTGVPTIARPFVNINGDNVANLIAVNLDGATALTGSININAFSSFESSSVLLRYAAASTTEGCRYYQLDYLAGYRYARLRDSLTFATHTRSVENPSSVPVGTTIDINEQFSTVNRFLGADFGMHMRVRNGCYTLDVIGRVAVGSMARELSIDGSTVTSVPGATAVTTQGGLLAQRSNIGTFRDDKFSVMPDIGIKLGMDLHPNLRLTAGYNFIALANVARAGKQIDTTINTSQSNNRPLVGEARPSATYRDSGYWAHGMSFGLEGEF